MMTPGSEENEEPAFGEMHLPSVQKKRARTLDSVISTLTERKSSKHADPGGMALPVFRSDPDGDVLISCVDWNCNCNVALHSRMAFRGQSYRRIGGAGRSAASRLYHQQQLQLQLQQQQHHLQLLQQQQQQHLHHANGGGGGLGSTTAAHSYKCKPRNRHGESGSTPRGSLASKMHHSTNGGGGGGSCGVGFGSDQKAVGAQNDIKEFAEYFKRRRFELGYTQKDVAAALADEYRDIEYTQPSIAKFEHLHFSPNRLTQMRNRLQKWLDEAERIHGAATAAAAAAAAAAAISSGLKSNSDHPVVVVNGHSQAEPLNGYSSLNNNNNNNNSADNNRIIIGNNCNDDDDDDDDDGDQLNGT
ncbi:POU domain protein CF1A [Trichinella pseudospiralis]|uniref:POU domain protein CF1A n=1 Tax=Trichinella pseudospiralis TaxID=6337 RepID=A0A0V1DYX1_TRIPS|nr:POU domain protein CF1A [Trichinella pseudospiralis]